MSDSDNDSNPFTRKVMTRQPGLVGAQWWNDGLSAMSDPVSRRRALLGLATLGAMVSVAGLAVVAASGSEGSDDETLETHESLKMQRTYGWNVGATDNALTFSGQTQAPLRQEDLAGMATQLTPVQDSLKPFSQATLFQALSDGTLAATTGSARTLREALHPISTPDMDTAFNQGLALGGLFAQQEQTALATAVLVDLPGPQAVAFTVALAPRFEPVFTFDNWPHPLGVVPAHLTLAAVATYQSRFKQLAQERKRPAPPVFVLDRQRLAPYTDEATQFDNRYVARLPTAAQLRQLGIQHVLYVFPGDNGPVQEMDDLNDDFVAWRAAGLDVKLVAASDFKAEPSESASLGSDAGTPDAGTAGPPTAQGGATAHPYLFGGSRTAHESFWTVYPWTPAHTAVTAAAGIAAAGVLSTRGVALVPGWLSGGYAYEPQSRSTMFSSVPRGASGAPRPLPSGFGKVAMRVSTQSRSILGPAFASRSSWNRSSNSFFGG